MHSSFQLFSDLEESHQEALQLRTWSCRLSRRTEVIQAVMTAMKVAAMTGMERWMLPRHSRRACVIQLAPVNRPAAVSTETQLT